MKSLANVLAVLALSSGLATLPACKEEAKKSSTKKSASDDGTKASGKNTSGGSETPVSSGSKAGDCKTSSSSGSGEETVVGTGKTSSDGTTATWLAETKVTYDDDIKSILESNCTSCHKAGGSATPDLTSYSLAKTAASSSNSDVQKGTMPMTAPLSSTDKATFQKWIDDGTLEKASADTASSGDTGSSGSATGDSGSSGSSSGTSSNCTGSDTTNSGGSSGTTTDATGDSTTTDTTGDATDPWAELITPQALTDCKNQNKIYDRAKGACDKADIAKSYECTHSGIVAVFKKLAVAVETQLQAFETDGYSIDQCGEYQNEPIVFFHKKVEGEDELKLQIKKLCKKGSAACIP